MWISRLWMCCILFWPPLAFGNCDQIDINRTKQIAYKGFTIDENNLHQFLESHEKILIFGKQMQKPEVRIVNVEHVNNRTRVRRSTNKILRLNIHNKRDEIQLMQANKLIDDAFMFIIRNENSSQLVGDSLKLANNLSSCFYRNENAALDICNGYVRGILHRGDKDLVIHPLPERFGRTSHIVYESTRGVGADSGNSIVPLNFEPHQENFEPENNNSISNRFRLKRDVNDNNIPSVLYVETAIFVDKDLYRHMAKNYPKNTESHLIRFVLAMINGVQLLYHHPSLGHQINFVLKRLEILHTDPKDLHRSSDIDVFLNSFCAWQRKLNPIDDSDAVHFDHAVILTGLDLYVVSKMGKVSSQVVGLAPVAGMCTPVSSCTINEGKHFESVFVVAHEIGHNLGMRHDTAENNCDPSLYIMSPTLGSGKITWSKCSRDYLNMFLRMPQAKCLFDRGSTQSGATLDHSAEGILPGERFDADQQCMLKYGRSSVRSRSQDIGDICRDLHCQRDRYTWTSHPALEGTYCGDMMWCKSGVCKLRNSFVESYLMPRQGSNGKYGDKSSSLVEYKKISQLKQEAFYVKSPAWSSWSRPSECESGCLYGESGRLLEGSTGLKMFTRNCLESRSNRKRCTGMDRKYESCSAKQCYDIVRTTVLDFANQVCERAKQFDKDIAGSGLQKLGASEDESCYVFCQTFSGPPKTKNWIFPDGTSCKNRDSDFDDTFYCINGRCEKFFCNRNTSNFQLDPLFCPQSLVLEDNVQKTNSIQQENGKDYKSLTTIESETTTEPIFINIYNSSRDVIVDKVTVNNQNATIPRKIWSASSTQATSLPLVEKQKYDRQSKNKWIVKSGCHFGCMDLSKGIQIVASSEDGSQNVQLCAPAMIPCDRLKTTYEYSTKLCTKYKLKVRGLSGKGMQIAPSAADPDRSCKVACQDDYIPHRFYLVNGEQGFFPFGTKCSKYDNRYCINGKCLEFDRVDETPLSKSHVSLALFRYKRELTIHRTRRKRNFINFTPVNITENINRQFIDNILATINFSMEPRESIDGQRIDLENPVYVSSDVNESIV